MIRKRWLGLFIASGFFAGGCSLLVTADPKHEAETSEALCSDGLDNDGNSLTDCQDYNCLGKKACCTFPVVLVNQSFKQLPCAQQTCCRPTDLTCKLDATCTLDPLVWQTWGVPEPLLCGGGLNPYKLGQCYDVGAVAAAPIQLGPGLEVSAHLAGQPEAAAHLELGLTNQPKVSSGASACAPSDGVTPMVSIKLEAVEGGAAMLTLFGGQTVGASPLITDGAPHLASMRVSKQRLVEFALDGKTFALSSPTKPLPSEALTVYLSLSGRGGVARFEDVHVTSGVECESPTGWSAVTPMIALEPSTNTAWDSLRIYNPLAGSDASGQTALYYSACGAGTLGSGCLGNYAFGRAYAKDQLTFTRDKINPLVVYTARTHPVDFGIFRAETPTNFPDVFGFFSRSTIGGTFETEIYVVGQAAADATMFPYDAIQTDGVKQGPMGAWDDGQVCCASAVEHQGRIYLWYAGRHGSDPTWRIGLATSSDGKSFNKLSSNPVLREGGPDDFDGSGLRDPEVAYDPSRSLFRAWYTGVATLGLTSIGYAISTDGERWVKYPGNPVVTAKGLMVDSIESPAVMLEEGQERMWVDGTDNGRPGLRLYGLINKGLPPP